MIPISKVWVLKAAGFLGGGAWLWQQYLGWVKHGAGQREGGFGALSYMLDEFWEEHAAVHDMVDELQTTPGAKRPWIVALVKTLNRFATLCTRAYLAEMDDEVRKVPPRGSELDVVRTMQSIEAQVHNICEKVGHPCVADSFSSRSLPLGEPLHSMCRDLFEALEDEVFNVMASIDACNARCLAQGVGPLNPAQTHPFEGRARYRFPPQADWASRIG